MTERALLEQFAAAGVLVNEHGEILCLHGRTPLSAILNLAELLQMQSSGPLTEKQGLYTQTIYQNGRHLLALINDVSDLAKVSAGRMELDLGQVSVAETCQLALKQLP